MLVNTDMLGIDRNDERGDSSFMDDGSPIRLLIYIFLLLLGSAYFASAEMALTSVNKIRMMSYADDGNRRAAKVLTILGDFDRALTTILIGNNIMQIGCATLATLLATRLWGNGAVSLTTLITTVVVFLFTEILPKSFAKACNEQWAQAVSGSMLFFMRVMKPITLIFNKLSNLLSRPFMKKSELRPTVTEDELHDIIDTIVEEGELDEDEGELVQNALEFAETEVREVYTPWYKVVRVNLSMSSETIIDVIKSCAHSRLPVTGQHGAVIGILPIRSYLKAYLKDKDVTLSEVMVDANFVADDMPIDALLQTMSDNKTHMVVVIDREGKTLGVITMEDILEELVGEIYDEEDPEGGIVQ